MSESWPAGVGVMVVCCQNMLSSCLGEIAVPSLLWLRRHVVIWAYGRR